MDIDTLQVAEALQVALEAIEVIAPLPWRVESDWDGSEYDAECHESHDDPFTIYDAEHNPLYHCIDVVWAIDLVDRLNKLEKLLIPKPLVLASDEVIVNAPKANNYLRALLSINVRMYKSKTLELKEKRAAGLLSMDDQGEYAEVLDEIWRELSSDERMILEEWIAKENINE